MYIIIIIIIIIPHPKLPLPSRPSGRRWAASCWRCAFHLLSIRRASRTTCLAASSCASTCARVILETLVPPVAPAAVATHRARSTKFRLLLIMPQNSHVHAKGAPRGDICIAPQRVLSCQEAPIGAPLWLPASVIIGCMAWFRAMRMPPSSTSSMLGPTASRSTLSPFARVKDGIHMPRHGEGGCIDTLATLAVMVAYGGDVVSFCNSRHSSAALTVVDGCC